MKWQAFDYTVRLDRKPTDADYLLEGSPTAPTEAEEIWTFARANDGANDGANTSANTNTARWILSAIQQVA
jgi:predicted lipid-binding transport protein (Tim44 family)